MKNNSFNFYPSVYKVIALIVCMILVILFNKSKAEGAYYKCKMHISQQQQKNIIKNIQNKFACFYD